MIDRRNMKITGTGIKKTPDTCHVWKGEKLERR